jgi:hypothetical protein
MQSCARGGWSSSRVPATFPQVKAFRGPNLMCENSFANAALVENAYVVLRLTYLGARFRILLDIARGTICRRVAVLLKKLKRVHQGVRGCRLSASSALEPRLLGAL